MLSNDVLAYRDLGKGRDVIYACARICVKFAHRLAHLMWAKGGKRT